jgi:hypothetical protein
MKGSGLVLCVTADPRSGGCFIRVLMAGDQALCSAGCVITFTNPSLKLKLVSSHASQGFAAYQTQKSPARSNSGGAFSWAIDDQLSSAFTRFT